MKSHELAAALLALPDLDVVVNDDARSTHMDVKGDVVVEELTYCAPYKYKNREVVSIPICDME